MYTNRRCLFALLIMLELCSVTSRDMNAQTPVRPNILFIIADDLNDYLEGYASHPNTLTPNLAILQEQGTTFLNAYASAPICAPSRTSFLTGKDLLYTGVYRNTDGDYKCKDFGNNFTEASGNEEYYTIPQYFKDSLGYYTFNINKVFHCHKNYIEYDDETIDPCGKSGAWNRYMYYYDSAYIDEPGYALDQGVNGYAWAAIPDSLEYHMTDYVATDSVIDFIQQFAASPDYTCNKPFMIMLGYHKPHKEQFIPEKYFLDDYMMDMYATPFNPPYNYPENTYPPNGMILPPQPDTPFADLDALMMNSISALMVKNIDTQIVEWAEAIVDLPEIDPALSDSERIDLLTWSKRANATMAYLAAVKYIDAQFGRVYTELLAHPDIMENTVVVFIGDNGYGLGEKRHWGKYALWDTDVRIPMIIADLRDPKKQVCNRTVSLLDLFPTLIELAGDTSLPLFEDGDAYLDGYSLRPLIQQADTVWNRPVISATLKQGAGGEANCFPQYSVRDERFHLIRYETNGGDCDTALSTNQWELYELGLHREVDPYEWHNLANDSAYLPVIDFLSQFLPGEPLYLAETYTLHAEDQATECLLSHVDTLHPLALLYSVDGALIDVPDGFTLQWSNNVTADIYSGLAPEIPMSDIPEDLFSVQSRIIFYATLTDSLGQIHALDLVYVYVNPENAPEIFFTIEPYGVNTVIVDSFSITGNYLHYWWDFGFGKQFDNQIPGPYTYDNPEPYSIACYAEFGNDTSCITQYIVSILPADFLEMQSTYLTIWPNPTSTFIQFSWHGQINSNCGTIYSASGQPVARFSFDEKSTLCKLDVSGLPEGLYYITIDDERVNLFGKFIIVK